MLQRSRANPSQKKWRCCLQVYCVWKCATWVWEVYDGMNRVMRLKKERERWGREGRKTKGISSIRYKGTCTKMSHEQTTSVHKTFKHDGHNRTTEVTSSQRSITHLWLLQRTNKYVLTNNHFKCFSFQKLNHKQASSAPFSSKLGYGLDFWLVAFVFKRCWIRLAANRILNLCLKSFWSLRPLIK